MTTITHKSFDEARVFKTTFAGRELTVETGKVAQQDTCEIVEIKAADAPVIFEHFSELVIAEQTDDRQKQIIARDVEQVRKDVGKKPPDLPVQNFGRGEAEKTVDHAARVNDRQRIGNQIADGDDEHQVRNAAIAVFQTEAFEFFAEIFHMSTYLFCVTQFHQYSSSYPKWKKKSTDKV